MTVWLITGCSSGLGKELALAALSKGDKVIATCRGDAITRLQTLAAAGAVVLSLDVASPEEEIQNFAAKAISVYGTVDVLVNNAGWVQKGVLEENPDEIWRKQYQATVFGPVNMCRALLPHFREKRDGTIIMIGSQVSFMGFGSGGAYVSSKYAIAGVTACLAKEVAKLNIRVTCIEPGDIRTEVFKGKAPEPTRIIDDYVSTTGPVYAKYNESTEQPGNPVEFAHRIVQLVHGEGAAAGKPWPVRIPLGDDAYGYVLRHCEERARQAEEWKDWITGVSFPDASAL